MVDRHWQERTSPEEPFIEDSVESSLKGEDHVNDFNLDNA